MNEEYKPVFKPVDTRPRCEEHLHLSNVVVQCELEVHGKDVPHEGWLRAMWETIPHDHTEAPAREKADDPPEDR